MKRLRKKGKKVLSSLLMPLALASSIYLTPKKAHATEPENSFRIQHKFNYDNKLENDKLRLTFNSKNIFFRIDKNKKSQDQTEVMLKTINKEKTKLSIFGGIDPKKTLDDKVYNTSIDFGAILAQKLGELPLLGQTELELFQLNIHPKTQKPIRRYRAKLIGENLDLVYQLTKKSDGILDPQYYVAIHKGVVYTSLGKANGNKIHGSLAIVNNKDIGVFLQTYYDIDKKEFWLFTKNALKEANPGIYNLNVGRLGSNIFTIGTKPILFPIFSSHLTFGKYSHHGHIVKNPDEFEMTQEIGTQVTKNFGMGGGIYMKQKAGEKMKITPVISGYIQIPLGKQQKLYFGGTMKDKKTAFYVHTEFKF